MLRIQQAARDAVDQFFDSITDFDAPIDCNAISKAIVSVPGVASVGIHVNDWTGSIDANVEIWTGQCFTVRIADNEIGGDDGGGGEEIDDEEFRLAA
jgi:copper chaperone CopZ